tara:strand:+ start:1419 stop:1724 length:306 start_codon:yes stop_codon:yes gene_type:complete
VHAQIFAALEAADHESRKRRVPNVECEAYRTAKCTSKKIVVTGKMSLVPAQGVAEFCVIDCFFYKIRVLVRDLERYRVPISKGSDRYIFLSADSVSGRDKA